METEIQMPKFKYQMSKLKLEFERPLKKVNLAQTVMPNLFRHLMNSAH